ncbi:Nmad3 family putative nucleotide modification protein [Salinarchaeum laminariae]|uniref:Nmad3 family putative nucleotide modification protein n=1 Tax=Salinarchaeum laminariae TaxID=869888 RepID=UPI0020BE9E2E|nr:hypothetical protein [Salinarchaeum laminariae]
MKSVAINVGANSKHPGGRGPIYADGSFEYIPIPESHSTVRKPTYDSLGIDGTRPNHAAERAVHFDPEFPEYSLGREYTYGDRHSPKTDRLAELETGDVLFFYATLDHASDDSPRRDWINEDWGAYIIGHFTLERDPISREEYENAPPELRERLQGNAHARRPEFDAEYIVLGDREKSALYRTPVPLSGKEGTEPNEFVTEHSGDPGGGPWYRRPLTFDESSTERLLEAREEYHRADPAGPAVHSRESVEAVELGEGGQLQFFFHSAQSELPVRAAAELGKTEPHIEKRAENYCNECYQPNIRSFLNDNSRRYLLLFTRCRNSDLGEHDDRRYVVGYIDKEEKLDMGDHLAVRGDTRLVSFDDAVPLADLVDSHRSVRVEILDSDTTRQAVEQLDNGENRLDDCLDELDRLESFNTDDVPPPSGTGC